jgi:hypothetical protein
MEFTPQQKQVLKNTIAKDATDAELGLFLQACTAYGLNPFKKEIFFSKSQSGKVEFITSRDGYLALIQKDPNYMGIQSMEVYSGDDFSMEFKNDNPEGIDTIQIDHTIDDIDPEKRGTLLGAWATCYYKGRAPATAMIRKVPESIVLKRQGGFSGLVTREEIEGDPSVDLITAPTQTESEPEPEPTPAERPGPKDVTDQYTKPSEDGQFATIQISESDMFEEYQVCHGNDTFNVVCSKETNNFNCKTCDSDHCEHVKAAQQYRATL